VVDARFAKVRHTNTINTTTTWTTRIRYGRCSAGAQASREYIQRHHSVSNPQTAPTSVQYCSIKLNSKTTIGLLVGYRFDDVLKRRLCDNAFHLEPVPIRRDRSSLRAVSAEISARRCDSQSNLALYLQYYVCTEPQFKLIFS